MDWKRLGWAFLLVIALFAVIGLLAVLVMVSKGLVFLLFMLVALVSAAYSILGS